MLFCGAKSGIYARDTKVNLMDKDIVIQPKDAFLLTLLAIIIKFWFICYRRVAKEMRVKSCHFALLRVHPCGIA